MSPRVARGAAVVAWLVLAVVLLRIASGGGSLTGVRYVIRTEPIVIVVASATALIAAALAVLGLLRDTRRAWRVSTVAAVLAVAVSVALVLGGHDSAVLAGLAAGLVLVLGWAAARGEPLAGA